MSDETMPGAPGAPAAAPRAATNAAAGDGTAAPTSEPTPPSSSEFRRGDSPGDSPARSDSPDDSPNDSAVRGESPDDSPSDSPRESGDGVPRRPRRRGSRGGRNRRKRTPASAAADAVTEVTPAAEPDTEPGSPEVDETMLGHDYTSPAADRGLTTEDVADTALEEAGLTHTPRPRIGDSRPAATATEPSTGATRPRIGDSRPAPVAPPTNGEPNGEQPNGDVADVTRPARRRRRRGGRGRGRAGAQSGMGTATANAPAMPASRTEFDDVVRADLGVGDAPLAAPDDEFLERRRGRTRKGRPAGRYMMCVHVIEGAHTHIAVLEGRNLVEHYLATPTGNESIDGNIYLGRVQNVLPGMEAAFVDIGTPKNGVLYRGDVAFDKSDVEGGAKPKIERLLKNGQMIVVQVTKNPIAHKGARLTQEVSLAGRFLVMVPGEPETYGISKRLPDDERRRLRRILDGIRPDDAGLIVRTAAEGATQEELERDVRRLRNQWEQISELAAKSKSPKLLYQEPDLVLRLIREEFTKEYRGIVIDDTALYEETRAYVEAIAPELADRVEYYDVADEGLPIFERFHISEQLLKALDRKVWLPSGGSLVIERTEALTVIDVNTAKNVGKTNLEETVFRNNLEAAEEIARQLRLRDIGGIIVIDFIDMEIKANRDEVMKVFRDALARDKTRTQAFEMSELGLVEMTRKRISEGLVESFSETCPTCHGRGFLLDESLLRSMD
jgi:ribonuclease E